jgi:signal transduction histidine kinase
MRENALRKRLQQSFLFRVKAVFYARLAINLLYAVFFLLAINNSNILFPCDFIDALIIIFSFVIIIISHNLSSNKTRGKWLLFFSLICDLLINLFFCRKSGYILSSYITIHPFICALFVLLFHNPIFLIAPLAIIPLATLLLVQHQPIFEAAALMQALLLFSMLDALIIFIIHPTQGQEQRLMRSLFRVRERLKELAIIKDRQRIARDFHDGIGSKLTSIIMHCDYISLSENTNYLFSSEIKAIKESALSSMDDMRITIAFLRSDFDITEQLHIICDNISKRHKLEVNRENLEYLSELSPEDKIAFFYIIQESITNILKHAQASIVNISCLKNHQKITVSIADNGQGFNLKDKKHNSFGLDNMLNRAQQINADLSIYSIENNQTVISISKNQQGLSKT